MLSCFALWLHVTRWGVPLHVGFSLWSTLARPPLSSVCLAMAFTAPHLLDVCLYDFPSESSHGARRYASYCIRSDNFCHQCALRCGSHGQSGLLIYSFVSSSPTLTPTCRLCTLGLGMGWDGEPAGECLGASSHGVSEISLVDLHKPVQSREMPGATGQCPGTHPAEMISVVIHTMGCTHVYIHMC